MNVYERILKLLAAVLKMVVDGARDAEEIATILQGIVDGAATKVNAYLRRLFADQTIEVRVRDNADTLAGAKGVFTGGIFEAKPRGICRQTPKTAVAIYELVKDGTFAQIFGGFGENLRRLCLTESQIVAFCRDHPDLLRKGGYDTFFLFEGEEGNFFVALVSVGVFGRLRVGVVSLGHGYVWRAKFGHRFVVPQLAA